MFGITNDCNLSCAFCSRDQSRASRWTVESAFEVLRDLASAGVLEVAFGGGEPFVFPGFAALVARLHDETPLALNVTTNGTQLDHATWAPFAGRFGQVRVSIYGDTVWRRCAELFVATGQRWGANILVDDAACAALPAVLEDLAAAGCHDVSLLGYVGEPARLLSPGSRRRIAEVALASPLPCRISVCFGSSLDVPRLVAGFDNDGDCGAGNDFISVTPDQRVQSCSFQGGGFAGTTAAEILTVWRTRRATLALPALRSGCARLHRDQSAPPPLPEIAIWQGFSGNNSGECIMVARFRAIEDARAYLDELLPGWQQPTVTDERFSPAWEEIFARQQVAGASMTQSERFPPDELIRIGRCVLASGYGLDDNFPELRALAWKRGAQVHPGGIHLHEPTNLVGAIATRDDRDRDEVIRGAVSAGMEPFIHGRTVFVRAPARASKGRSLTAETDALLDLAAGRPLAAEPFTGDWMTEEVTAALQRLGQNQAERERLWIRFPHVTEGPAEARRFAATLADQRTIVGTNWLLIDPVLGRKRVAVLAYRRDATVTALDAEQVCVEGHFWRLDPPRQRGTTVERPPMPTAEALRLAIRRYAPLLRETTRGRQADRDNLQIVAFLSSDPASVITAFEAAATELELQLWLSLRDPASTRSLLVRLQADLAG
jgi:hypothetical protein